MSKTKTAKKNTITTYKKVAANICKENNSYRVRFVYKGKRISKSFTTRKAAIEYRNANVC